MRKAVKGMLPRNRLARAQIDKLKIYAGPEHPHAAQAPEAAAAGGLDGMSEIAQYRGTGKRKTSVARVILRPGDGDDVVQRPHARGVLPARRRTARRCSRRCKVAGAEGTLRPPRPRARRRPSAARPARCATASPARSSRPIRSCASPLKREGFLTRDARKVERKKAGLHKARKAPQFSKR